MGNYRFRLSDMMPNAWFYKLRDMSKQTRNHHSKKKQSLTTTTTTTTTSKTSSSRPKEQNQPLNPPRPRKSYYFTRDLNLVGKSLTSADKLLDPPRKSSKQRTRKRNSRCSPKRVTTSSSSVSAGCSCRLDSVWTKSDSPPEYSSSPLDSSPELSIGEENAVPESFDGMVSWCSSCSCRVNSLSKPSDIVIEVDDKSFKTQLEKLQDNFDSISELHHLPPIITKPAGFNDMIDDIRKLNFSDKDTHKSLSVKVVKEQSISVQEHKTNTPARKVSLNSSQGVKLRIHSPKIASRKIQAAGRRSVSSSTSSSSGSRRSLSDSCAVVKSSFDPQRDFRESMMEMIVENNLKASKDLEDLLACYLSLNSDEYHELIIKVFKQIWFDLNDIRFK